MIVVSMLGCTKTVKTSDGDEVTIKSGETATILEESEFDVDRIDIIGSRSSGYTYYDYIMVCENDECRLSCLVTEREYTLFTKDTVLSGKIVCKNTDGIAKYIFVVDNHEYGILYSTIEE